MRQQVSTVCRVERYEYGAQVIDRIEYDQRIAAIGYPDRDSITLAHAKFLQAGGLGDRTPADFSETPRFPVLEDQVSLVGRFACEAVQQVPKYADVAIGHARINKVSHFSSPAPLPFQGLRLLLAKADQSHTGMDDLFHDGFPRAFAARSVAIGYPAQQAAHPNGHLGRIVEFHEAVSLARLDELGNFEIELMPQAQDASRIGGVQIHHFTLIDGDVFVPVDDDVRDRGERGP